MKLIDKDALVAEIEKICAEEKAIFDEQCRGGYEPSPSPAVVCMKMEHLLSFIDTLEVKEVDLDDFIKEEFDKYACVDGYGQLSVSYNSAEFYSMIKRLTKAQKGE